MKQTICQFFEPYDVYKARDFQPWELNAILTGLKSVLSPQECEDFVSQATYGQQFITFENLAKAIENKMNGNGLQTIQLGVVPETSYFKIKRPSPDAIEGFSKLK